MSVKALHFFKLKKSDIKYKKVIDCIVKKQNNYIIIMKHNIEYSINDLILKY